jgi:hypothetical protein
MSDRELFKAALNATPDCLSLQQLEELASGRTQAPPHLLQCPRCQSELAMLKSFESSTPLPGEGAAVAWISSQLDRQLDQIKSHSGVAGRRSRATSSSWFAHLFGQRRITFAILATACALIAVTSVVLLRSSKEPELSASMGNDTNVYRSAQIQTISPLGDITAVPKTLAWQAFPGSSSYKVVLMEVDKSVLWSAETKDTSVTLPDGARARIVNSKPILWQVTAVGASGNVLAASSTQRFVYRQHSRSTDPLLPQ